MLLWECWCGWHCGFALTARHSIIDVMLWGRSPLQRAVFVNWQGVVHESESVPEQQVLELLCATSFSGYTEVCVCVFVCLCACVCVSLAKEFSEGQIYFNLVPVDIDLFVFII